MKYVCFGYCDTNKFRRLSDIERRSVLDACIDYDDHLRASGHLLAGELLQSPELSLTLSLHGGEVAIAEGLIAQTPEQLGGVFVLAARDMNHAVQLMTQHPILKYSSALEIRPTRT